MSFCFPPARKGLLGIACLNAHVLGYAVFMFNRRELACSSHRILDKERSNLECARPGPPPWFGQADSEVQATSKAEIS